MEVRQSHSLTANLAGWGTLTIRGNVIFTEEEPHSWHPSHVEDLVVEDEDGERLEAAVEEAGDLLIQDFFDTNGRSDSRSYG